MAIPDAVQRLEQLSLFRGLSPEALQLIGNLAEEARIVAGETVFKQNAMPDYCYVVERGVVRETGTDPSGATILNLQTDVGHLLGRWAVFNNDNHKTTAAAVQPATLLRFKGGDFQSLLSRFPLLRERLQRTGRVNRLRAIPLFGSFDEEQLFQVAELAEEVEYEMGVTIFRQGDPADCFYVIDSGRVVEDVTVRTPGSQEWPGYFTAGSFFGRHSLLQGTKRRATATADTHLKLFRFGARALDWLRQLQPGFDDALRRFQMLELLKKPNVFRDMEEQALRQLAGYVGLAHYPQGTVLVFQDEIDPTFYQLYQGEAVKRFRDERGKTRPIGVVGAGDCIGENCLFFEEPWGFSVEIAQPTSLLYLYRDDLDQFVLSHPNVRDKLIPVDRLATKLPRKAFAWLGLDEHVILRCPRHWFALLDRLLGWPSLLWLALFLVLLFLPLGDGAARRLAVLGAVIVAVAYPLWRVVDWINDYLVVTTKRVVHREKILWVSEKLYEVPLGKVQNVNIRQGFVGNLLGFGRLDVDTAATSGVQPLSFGFLTDPNQVQKRVFEELERVRAVRRPEARHAIRERLEAGTRRGIQPSVPKPVAPPSKPVQVRPGMLGRAYEATLGAAFWVEKRLDDEIIWRKHRLRLLAKVFVPTFLAVLVFLAYFLIVRAAVATLPFLLIALAPIGFWWWWRWADWGNDLYILTPDRIVDTERLPLGIRSRRTETIFDRIQNVTYDIPNPIATLFNYGTVSIHTAGVEGVLDFPYVPRPRQVHAEIFRRIAAHEEAQRRKQQEQFEVADWFSVYDQARP